jgi:ABC-type branched-subunit amino acid transport system permease subunit
MTTEVQKIESEKDYKFKLRKFEEIISKNQLFICIVAFLYIIPLFTNSELSSTRATIDLITKFLIFGIFALSFDFQLGRSGLLNFGQAAFFGVGAYITMWHLKSSVFSHIVIPLVEIPLSNIFGLVPFPVTLLSAIFFGLLLGLIMGSTTNRMKGTAFAFIALAIAMLLFEFMEMPDNVPISGGESGLGIDVLPIMQNYITYLLFVLLALILVILAFITVFLDLKERDHVLFVNFKREPLATDYTENGRKNNKKIIGSLVFSVLLFGVFLFLFIPNILDMYFFAKDYVFKIPIQYYFVLSLTILVYVFVKRVVNSPFGRVLAAVAQNEERMEALGYNTFLYKIMAVGISGGLAGLAGSLYTTYALTIGTLSTFGVLQTIDAMLYTITGGLGTILGPFLGTIVVQFSELRLVDLIEVFNIDGEWWLVVLGIIFILIIMFFPHGIVGSVQIRANKIKTNLRDKFGIRESDYWWISLILIFIAFIFMVNLELFIDWIIEMIQTYF